MSCHNQKSFKSYIPSAVTIRNHSKVTYLQLSQSEIIQKNYIPSAVHRPSQLGPVDTDLEVVWFDWSQGAAVHSLVQLTLILLWSDLIEARERQFTAWSSWHWSWGGLIWLKPGSGSSQLGPVDTDLEVVWFGWSQGAAVHSAVSEELVRGHYLWMIYIWLFKEINTDFGSFLLLFFPSI